MRDDVSDIAFFYNSNPGREHSRLEQHQLEYELTWRYLEHYLPAQGSILEVGAATGKYTLELVKRGYKLTAVDLSAALLEACRQCLADDGLEKQVRFVVADARDLGDVPEQGFDAVLLMGPLYHLIVEADRKVALQQAFDRLRAGGVLFTALLSRLGMLSDLLKNKPDWIEDPVAVRSQLEQGRRPGGYARGGFRGYAALAAEIAPCMKPLDLKHYPWWELNLPSPLMTISTINFRASNANCGWICSTRSVPSPPSSAHHGIFSISVRSPISERLHGMLPVRVKPACTQLILCLSSGIRSRASVSSGLMR